MKKKFKESKCDLENPAHCFCQVPVDELKKWADKKYNEGLTTMDLLSSTDDPHVFQPVADLGNVAVALGPDRHRDLVVTLRVRQHRPQPALIDRLKHVVVGRDGPDPDLGSLVIDDDRHAHAIGLSPSPVTGVDAPVTVLVP